jgi:hypothetical protein
LFLLLPSSLSSLLFDFIVSTITDVVLVAPTAIALAAFFVLAAFVVALAVIVTTFLAV